MNAKILVEEFLKEYMTGGAPNPNKGPANYQATLYDPETRKEVAKDITGIRTKFRGTPGGTEKIAGALAHRGSKAEMDADNMTYELADFDAATDFGLPDDGDPTDNDLLNKEREGIINTFDNINLASQKYYDAANVHQRIADKLLK